jgi:predicted O-methyltransferase YrrM
MAHANMKHFYETVPGWCAFEELYIEMVRRAPREAQFVEVGSWLGRSAALMAVEIVNSGKNINFVCIDPWEDGGPDLRDTPYYQNLKHPVYDLFLENIRPVRHVVTPLRMTSLVGATKFADGEIDFLMLDGDHSYEAVRDDIAAWLPKMKKSGVISGDDYLWPGVTRAADRVFGSKLQSVIKKRDKDYKMSVAYWWAQV